MRGCFERLLAFFSKGSWWRQPISAVLQAVGNAIDRWVAMGYRLLREGYPGTAGSASKKEDVLNRLHRAAYKQMPQGKGDPLCR